VEYVVKSTKGGIFALLVGNLPIKGGETIQLFSGDKGWTMDKGGVSEAEVTATSEFQLSLRRQMHNLLTSQTGGDGMFLRFGGGGIVDLRPVDWVEFSDQNGNVLRLSLDRSSRLPSRTIVTTPNEENGQNDEDITVYSNYQILQGVQTPMQVSREHNGRRTYQIFYDTCKNSPALAADFFTKEALEKLYAEKGGKKKDKK